MLWSSLPTTFGFLHRIKVSPRRPQHHSPYRRKAVVECNPSATGPRQLAPDRRFGFPNPEKFWEREACDRRIRHQLDQFSASIFSVISRHCFSVLWSHQSNAGRNGRSLLSSRTEPCICPVRPTAPIDSFEMRQLVYESQRRRPSTSHSDPALPNRSRAKQMVGAPRFLSREQRRSRRAALLGCRLSRCPNQNIHC